MLPAAPRSALSSAVLLGTRDGFPELRAGSSALGVGGPSDGGGGDRHAAQDRLNRWRMQEHLQVCVHEACVPCSSTMVSSGQMFH